MDPLRQNVNRVVLTDAGFSILWDGTHLRVTQLGHDGRPIRQVWSERVCAVDSNAEEVARAWWTKIGRTRVEQFVEHADW